MKSELIYINCPYCNFSYRMKISVEFKEYICIKCFKSAITETIKKAEKDLLKRSNKIIQNILKEDNDTTN